MKRLLSGLLLTSPIWVLAHFFGVDVREVLGGILGYFSHLPYYYFGF
ncbi:hypothetical protein [Burkholderia stagnalis]|nr:hypothetical protein [Burkholderia stagnalis]